MVFIYWKWQNLENLAPLFAFPSRTSTSPVGWSPNHRLQSSFFLCVIFPSYATRQLPNHQDLEDIARGSSCQNSRCFWYTLLRRRARGRGGEPSCGFFSMPDRAQCPAGPSRPCLPIPTAFPLGASVGHGLPLVSTARAPQRATRALPALQAGKIWFGPASNDP